MSDVPPSVYVPSGVTEYRPEVAPWAAPVGNPPQGLIGQAISEGTALVSGLVQAGTGAVAVLGPGMVGAATGVLNGLASGLQQAGKAIFGPSK